MVPGWLGQDAASPMLSGIRNCITQITDEFVAWWGGGTQKFVEVVAEDRSSAGEGAGAEGLVERAVSDYLLTTPSWERNTIMCPFANRMSMHLNVILSEANVGYDPLLNDLDDANDAL